MTKSLPGLCVCIILLAVGCSQKRSIREVSLAREPLSIRAVLSPARGEPQAIVGRVIVHNASSGFLVYGNMHLFLVANGTRAVTRIRTAKTDAAGDIVQVDPMADTKKIDLAPGDSLVFASYWRFDSRLEFDRTPFSLEYDGQVVAPAASGTSRSGDSAAADVRSSSKQ